MTRDLKNKSIKIQGRDYVQVKDRVLFFNDTYINGSIITHLISEPNSEMVVVKAKATPDIANPDRYFTGYSQAKWGEGMVNKTAALENAETSAVGRALAMMGIGVIESVASADEMKKAGVVQHNNPMTGGNLATLSQTKMIFAMGRGMGFESEEFKERVKKTLGLESFTELTKSQASEVIDKLQKGEAI